VYSEKLLMMDRRTVRNMEFHFKNTFEKLVHLVGFIIRNIRNFLTCTAHPSIVLVVTSRRLRRTGHVAHTEGGGGDILVRMSEDKRRSVKRMKEAQDSAQWLDVVNTVTNRRVP
jgi:hypothetical protein